MKKRKFKQRKYLKTVQQKESFHFGPKGSITVEAAFLIPLCFFGMISLLYVGMYLHDWYVIETVTRTAAKREMQYVLQEERAEEGNLDWEYWQEKTIIWYLTADLQEENRFLIHYIESSLEGKLLLAEQPELTAQIDTGLVQVSYKSSVQWSMPFLAAWLNGRSSAAIEGEVRIIGVKAQEWVRMCRGLLSSGT